MTIKKWIQMRNGTGLKYEFVGETSLTWVGRHESEPNITFNLPKDAYGILAHTIESDITDTVGIDRDGLLLTIPSGSFFSLENGVVPYGRQVFGLPSCLRWKRARDGSIRVIALHEEPVE